MPTNKASWLATFSLYELLGVPTTTASTADVRAAHRACAKAYHPDGNGAPNATMLMALLNFAADVLTNPRDRKSYDQTRDLPAICLRCRASVMPKRTSRARDANGATAMTRVARTVRARRTRNRRHARGAAAQ